MGVETGGSPSEESPSCLIEDKTLVLAGGPVREGTGEAFLTLHSGGHTFQDPPRTGPAAFPGDSNKGHAP